MATLLIGIIHLIGNFCKRLQQKNPHIENFFAHTLAMGLIFVRTSILFITLLIVMRLMGKRQIGEMQPFEFIVTLIR